MVSLIHDHRIVTSEHGFCKRIVELIGTGSTVTIVILIVILLLLIIVFKT